MVHRGRRSPRGEERRRLWREAHHDRWRAERIATANYPLLGIQRGEVLTAPGGYVNPSLTREEG